uniref:Uncharacterized protein n=1 Tax=Setaria viridis TaxID=4556 RepID=A0A4U6TMB9_SETVI|nr:hypothetical protein SEVIR_8G241700v2 [Setaria viridis]
MKSVGALDLEAMKSVDELVSVNALDSDVAMESVDVVPDSVDVVLPDSIELMPDSVDVVPNSVEDVPDDDKVVHCPRCGTLHASGIFGDACFQARRNACRCARCGLLHEDYDISSKWLHLKDRFDCEFYIPDVAKLEMDGTIILCTDEVLKVDEHIKKQQTKSTKQD